jgi:hypothetical protein
MWYMADNQAIVPARKQQIRSTRSYLAFPEYIHRQADLKGRHYFLHVLPQSGLLGAERDEKFSKKRAPTTPLCHQCWDAAVLFPSHENDQSI